MSNSLSTSVVTPNNTGIVTKKSILKSTQSNSIEELLSVDSSFSVLDVFGGSTIDKNNTPHKPSQKKVSTEALTAAPTTATTKAIDIEGTEQQVQIQHHKINETLEDKQEAATDNSKRKLKIKKNKKSETVQQNLLVKSSFSKFDVLQKRNLIHVRSSGADNAQGKFRNPQGVKEINCRLCTKSVYKMEEMRAEKSIYHKNCFRCHECNKQLKVDNYRSHEGILYCIVHFKLLFNPKCVEDSIPEMPRKPELIVRENQPIELPPDVVRASDKPDLGLKELQQLNVRSRFKVFENAAQAHQEIGNEEPQRSFIKNSNSILSKIAKLRAQGVSSDLSIKAMSERDGVSDYSSCSDNGSSDAEVDKNSTENYEADFVRSKKRTQREGAVGLGQAMHDIKTKFEKGHLISKEERREERKQEIQNIRSRLFMGKQARFKEMYQQAVTQSEQGITASNKKTEIQTGGAARSLKERFERGDIFKDSRDHSKEKSCIKSGLENEADVFESAISKTSRSIFMELDANVTAGRKQMNTSTPLNRQLNQQHSYTYNIKQHSNENDSEVVIKYDEKPEDIKIETSEISSKFKFFESYCPIEQKKKEFRFTPPREGVVKMPPPESDTENTKYLDELGEEAHVLKKSHTTTTMLNKFREMEQKSNGKKAGPKPLKCFTPPLDGGERVYQDEDSSDVDSQGESEEFEYEDQDEVDDEDYDLSSERYKRSLDDEVLKEAQAAARAKQLRAKFEKWEANERENERKGGRVDIYTTEVLDHSKIESTKAIRERFENMKNSTHNTQTRPRCQVNRFV